MEIKDVRILDGPNRWAERPLIRLRLGFEDMPSAEPGAWNRCIKALDGLLPELPELWNYTTATASAEQAEPAVRLALLVATTALALARRLGLAVEFAGAKAVPRAERLYDLVFEQMDRQVGPGAGRLAALLVRQYAIEAELLPGEPEGRFDPGRAIAEFAALAERQLLSPAARALVTAAAERGIYCYRLDQASELLQFGQGCRQRRSLGTTPDCTGDLASRHAADAGYANRQLRAAGIPVPFQATVDRRSKALKAVQLAGYPVAVKAGAAGRTVARDVADEAALLQALEAARPLGPPILIEAVVPGDDHRLLTIGGRFVAALRRGASEEKPEDVTDDVHPDNRSLAERVARALELAVAGIDFLTPDISRSYREAGGAVRRVTPSPDLQLYRSASLQRDPIAPLLDLLFAPGEDGRIPIAAVTGTNGKTTTCLMVERIFCLKGVKVGSATTIGVRLDGQWLKEGDWAGGPGHRMVLAAPDIELAVLETARGGLIKSGMAFERCTVGAVTNVTEDHLGREEIETIEEMAEIKSLVPEHSEELVVLNAEDPLCVAMAKRSPAKRICYVSLDPANEVYRRQITSGGLAAGVEATDDGAMLVLHASGERHGIVAPESIPAVHGGRARFNLQNAAFAAAIAYGLGARLDEIAAGLTSFASDFESDPGRLNFYEGLPFKVLIDYGHNPGGLQAICEFLRHQEVAGERICVITGSGAQQAGQLHRQAAAVAPHFDCFVCYQSERPHRTKPGEVRQHIYDGLVAAGVAPERIVLAEDRAGTVEAVLRQAQPGDLVVIFAHYVLQAWRQVERYGREQGVAAH